MLTEERKQGRGYRTLSWQEIASLAATWKACGEKIVFTNGCFDILHVGHVTYLEKARNMGYEFWYMKTYYEGEPISFTVWNIVFPLLSFAFGLLAVAIRKDKQHTH